MSPVYPPETENITLIQVENYMEKRILDTREGLACSKTGCTDF